MQYNCQVQNRINQQRHNCTGFSCSAPSQQYYPSSNNQISKSQENYTNTRNCTHLAGLQPQGKPPEQPTRPRHTHSHRARSLTSTTSQTRAEAAPTYYVCPHCHFVYAPEMRVSLGCDHYMCESCLHSHIITLVDRGALPVCPSAMCQVQLSEHSAVYQSLPLRVRHKYTTIAKVPAATPKWQPQTGVCAVDQVQLQPHLPKIQSEQTFTVLSRATQEYRTCPQCHNICYKSKLSPVLQCRCEYQFCYICGQAALLSGHDCAGLASKRASTSYKLAAIALSLLVWLLVGIVVVIPKMLVKVVLMVLASVLAGTTFYTVMYIHNQETLAKKILLVLVLPVTMFIGIGMAFTIFLSMLLLEEKEFLLKIGRLLPSSSY